MKILIDNSGYRLTNLGDVAMLQAAVSRLNNLWPNALIQVITDAPDCLSKYCPKAQAINTRGRRFWRQNLTPLLHRALPQAISERLSYLELNTRNRWPAQAQSLIELKMKYKGIESDDMKNFLGAVSEADLVVASGGGYITDSFKAHGAAILDTLGLAIRCNRPAAMFGQGLGPISDRGLIARAKSVLPFVDVIALRERRSGLPLLDSMGIPRGSVITTGDDAIEVAFKARAAKQGTAIGVNLRAARYSEVDLSMVEVIGPALNAASKKHRAAMIPVPISLSDDSSDLSIIRRILESSEYASTDEDNFDTPLKIIEQVSRCRIVVTGSYHAGVFALAQGIPVVGLAKSDYYIDKFLGLADQFGKGCEVVLLENGLRENLASAIDRAWNSAERVRPMLLEAAARQIELSHDAYQRIYKKVESKRAVA